MATKMSFFRQSSLLWGAFGTGLCVGIGGTYLYFRMKNNYTVDLEKISRSIAELKAEISDLKANVPQRRRRAIPSFYSSSGETDDEAYEDALERNTDSEENVAPTEETEEESELSAFAEIDALLEGSEDDKKQAFSILLDMYKDEYLTNAEFLWRLAKSMFQNAQIAGALGNADRKKELLFNAKEIASKAVTVGDDCANAHKWFAITLGSLGDYQAIQDKIKNGYTFKEHIEKAIKLNPNDFSNHHLLGRWCFGVYMLSWLERKAAATLYATPPTSTAEEALKHFLEADRLNPGKWKENLLYIAKCYIQMSKTKEAAEWLQKAADLPEDGQDEKEVLEEIQTLCAKYKK